MSKDFSDNDVVVIPSRKKHLRLATAIKSVGNVTMVLPWDCGHEDIFLTTKVRLARKKEISNGIRRQFSNSIQQ